MSPLKRNLLDFDRYISSPYCWHAAISRSYSVVANQTLRTAVLCCFRTQLYSRWATMFDMFPIGSVPPSSTVKAFKQSDSGSSGKQIISGLKEHCWKASPDAYPALKLFCGHLLLGTSTNSTLS